jgi:hypothetical protein
MRIKFNRCGATCSVKKGDTNSSGATPQMVIKGDSSSTGATPENEGQINELCQETRASSGISMELAIKAEAKKEKKT